MQNFSFFSRIIVLWIVVVVLTGGTRRSPKSCEPSEPLVICIVTVWIVPEISIFGYLSVLKFDKTFDHSFLGHIWWFMLSFHRLVNSELQTHSMNTRCDDDVPSLLLFQLPVGFLDKHFLSTGDHSIPGNWIIVVKKESFN